MNNAPSPSLSVETIRQSLQAISDELGRRGVMGEVCFFWGTVMVLAFNARLATKDVDAVFHPAQEIREIASRVGEEKGLPEGWLNDGVKGFLASAPPQTSAGLPQFPNLRVTMPVAEYILAMKCIAGRTGEGADDIPDILFLVRHLNLKTAKEVLDIVAAYYGKSGISIRTQYLVEGLYEEGRV